MKSLKLIGLAVVAATTMTMTKEATAAAMPLMFLTANSSPASAIFLSPTMTKAVAPVFRNTEHRNFQSITQRVLSSSMKTTTQAATLKSNSTAKAS